MPAYRHLALLVVTVLVAPLGAHAAGEEGVKGPFDVRARTGKAPDPFARCVHPSSAIGGCGPVGPPLTHRLPGGGSESRQVYLSPEGHSCTVVERFSPTHASVRWDIRVEGHGEPWSAPIETRVRWDAAPGARFWAAWGDPRPGGGPGWADPLVPQPLADQTFVYGGTAFTDPTVVSLPLVTLLDPAAGRGLSIVQSPEDTLRRMTIAISRQGEVTFCHLDHRISAAAPVRLSIDLVVHEDDWRPALGWLARRYPAFVDPPNPRAHDVAGLGAYSSEEGDLDAARLAAMGFGVNWKASFDFPYMGMFLAPVPAWVEWTSFLGRATSVASLRDYSRRMRQQGFRVLNYFNVTEFGTRVVDPPPPRKAGTDADLWRDANDFLYHGPLRDAILPGPEGKPIFTWEAGIAMDPGDPAYRDFLLAQADRHIRQIPHSDGICIDRLDWLARYNPRFDDGVTWVNGGPARSLFASWAELMARLGPMMHAAGKVIFVNPHTRRLDLMRHVDGIYDEFGDMPHSLNACGLLGFRKPVMGWTASTASLQPDPDAVFQRHLHMGVHPTAPLPGNDHTIRPDPFTDPYYLDYGPLFDALRGRRWVTATHAIEVEGAVAKANVFAIAGGYAAPVTFGGTATSARVRLRNLTWPGPWSAASIDVLVPGRTAPVQVAVTRRGDTLAVDVPLVRGCGLLRLRHTWVTPRPRVFITQTSVAMGTGIAGATLRYTLDGSHPDARSRVYGGPLAVQATTTVRARAFRGAQAVGDEVAVECVKVPPPAPAISPATRVFEGQLRVSIGSEPAIPGATIRYTLDATDPTPASPVYSGPIMVDRDAEVRARLFVSGADPGTIAVAAFRKCPPEPPEPDVPLAALAPIRSSLGWGGSIRIDASIQGNPLSIAGKPFAHGVGTHAPSEIVYDLPATARAFVATVGVDDEMRAYTMASVVFQAFADGDLLAATPVLRLGDVWHLNVPIPPGRKQLRLVVTDAGDGMNCDHADWANAGFAR